MAKRRERSESESLNRVCWRAAKKDFFLALPWVPLYSAAEVGVAALGGTLVQLFFADTPRIPVARLVPSAVADLFSFGQTLDRKDLALAIPLLLVAAGFLKLISSFFSSYFIERAGLRVSRQLRSSFLAGFLNSAGNVHDGKNKDQTANQLFADTTILQSFVSRGTLSLIRDSFVLVAIFGAMIFIAAKTVAVTLLALIPLVLLLRYVSKKVHFFARESVNAQVRISTRMLQFRNGLLAVFGMRSQSRERADLVGMSEGYYRFIKKSFLVRTLFRPSMEWVLIAVLAILLQIRLTAQNEVDVATYSTLFILFTFSFQRLKGLSGVMTQWAEIRAVFTRLKEQWSHFVTSRQNQFLSIVSNSEPVALRAQKLSYKNDLGQAILDECNVLVKRGTRVALVGESGAGKTTFLRAVAGLIVPTDGLIEVESSRLYISQEPYVFKGTVRENIVYNSLSDSEKFPEDVLSQLVQSLSLAHSKAGANLFLDKHLGFLGEGLSGGEKARVALARSLYAKPELLLLDEPTANLDKTTGALLWDAVMRWFKSHPKHTVIAVSHALDEVRDFDYCYIFSSGKIVRHGIPKEIIGEAVK